MAAAWLGPPRLAAAWLSPSPFSRQQPMAVQAGQRVVLSFWRRAAPQKVWYEWAVTEPRCSALHNPAGRSYTIGL